MDCKQTHRHTKWLINETDETTLSVVNGGPPDTAYLQYPLDMDGVTLKGLLLPAHIR